MVKDKTFACKLRRGVKDQGSGSCSGSGSELGSGSGFWQRTLSAGARRRRLVAAYGTALEAAVVLRRVRPRCRQLPRCAAGMRTHGADPRRGPLAFVAACPFHCCLRRVSDIQHGDLKCPGQDAHGILYLPQPWPISQPEPACIARRLLLQCHCKAAPTEVLAAGYQPRRASCAAVGPAAWGCAPRRWSSLPTLDSRMALCPASGLPPPPENVQVTSLCVCCEIQA